MSWIRAVGAVIGRNQRMLRRRPDLIVQSAFVPIVVLFLCVLIFGASGDAWPIALVDNAKSDRSAALVDAIAESSSRISPYFRVVETDPRRADDLIRDGRLQLAIEIPRDYDRTGTVRISTYNINSDATKNLRLRVEDALNAHDAEAGTLPVTVDLHTVKARDVSRTDYIIGGVILLALFFGAALVAANLFALDHESRTSKELLLTPSGPATAAVGAAITATVAAFLTAVPTVATGMLAFGYRPGLGPSMLVLLFMTPVMLACAGLGTLLGQLLRVHRSIQPLVILTGIATFFAAGGFVSVPGLPPAARAFADAWPFSRIFTWVNPVWHEFADSFTPHQWAWSGGAAIVGLLAAAYAGRRERATPQRGGQ